jgi:hypothetical protein
MRILRLNNDLCELAEIGDELEDLQAEVQGYIELVTLGSTLQMVVNEEGRYRNFFNNGPATVLFRHFYGETAPYIVGPAFLCSFDSEENLVSLTDEDYEIAAKVLRSYGYVKGD